MPRSTPTALPISTAASSNVPRFAGPAGIADASATPDASSAAWPIVSWTPDAPGRPPRTRGSVAPQATTLSDERLDERPRPARDGQPAAELAGQLADPRPALGARRRSASAPGRRWAAIPTASADGEQRRRRRRPTSTALATIAADAQDEDRRRARSRRRRPGRRPARRRPSRGSSCATDALAVAEVVAPDQLAEPGRQDVVGEVADEQVAEHRRDSGPWPIGRDEALPAERPDSEVERR